MLMPKVPTLSEYWQQLEPHLPPFSPEERRVALALYREVAKGQPVDEAQLGRVLGISATESRALLQRDSINFLVHRDERGPRSGKWRAGAPGRDTGPDRVR